MEVSVSKVISIRWCKVCGNRLYVRASTCTDCQKYIGNLENQSAELNRLKKLQENAS